MNADILVIGGGGSGLCAAVAAAEKGSKVILVEKNKNIGGNTAMANGFFAIESRLQNQEGITTTAKEIFSASMDYAHWKINPEIIRAFIDKSADTISWLENKGLSFSLALEGSDKPKYSTYHSIQGTGLKLVKTLEDVARKMGVEMLTRCEIKKIIKDQGGAVSSAIAVSDGKEFSIEVKAIIIASGGYGGNREMLKKHYPGYTDDLCLMGVPCSGAGIQLAIDAGAMTEGLGTIHLHGPCFKGSHQIDALSRQPQALWVNKKGKRFCDESLTFFWPECSNILEQQPGNMMYSLVDARVVDRMKNEGTSALVLNVPPQTKLKSIEKNISDKMHTGKLKIADTWDEIADWIGIPPDELQKTTERYNRSCADQTDSLYYKNPKYLMALENPPIYAFECHASYLGTLGGIKINHHMETISTNGAPIPGLYTVGQDAGGWVSGTYNINMPGTTCGFAVNSGRIAGENASEYVSASCHS